LLYGEAETAHREKRMERPQPDHSRALIILVAGTVIRNRGMLHGLSAGSPRRHPQPLTMLRDAGYNACSFPGWVVGTIGAVFQQILLTQIKTPRGAP
jgi:hypothetical protein